MSALAGLFGYVLNYLYNYVQKIQNRRASYNWPKTARIIALVLANA